MRTRRGFLKLGAAAGAVVLTGRSAPAAEGAASPGRAGEVNDDRAYWCGVAQRLASPMLPALAGRKLKVTMPAMEAPGTFDANGWLRIGLAGSQPGLGETYISTGSLYLCSVALLPLGLAPADPFWSAPREKTTWEKAWSGENLPADKAIKSPR